MLTPELVFTSILFVWIATALCIAVFWPVYRSIELLVMAGATTLVGTAIAYAGAALRWPSWLVGIAAAGAYLVLGVPLAVPGRAVSGVFPTLDGFSELLAGTALAWKELVTISIPVGSYQALLVPPFFLTLAATTIAVSIALRIERGELAIIPVVVFFGLAVALGSALDFAPFAIGTGMLATVLLWSVWRRWYRRRDAIRDAEDRGARVEATVRRDNVLSGATTLAGAATIIAIAAAAGIGATLLAPPSSARSVLRAVVEQPFDTRDYASPLSGFRRYHQTPTATEPLLTVTGLPDGARVRIATLDSYDGIVYAVGSAAVDSASGSFTRVPSTVDQSATDGTAVSVEVQIEGYSGVWVPTVGQLADIEFLGDEAADLRGAFFYNDFSGTAADVAGLDAGDRYTLRAVIPEQPTDDELTELTPGASRVPDLGVLPDGVTDTLSSYVGDTEGDGARLQAALDGLRESGYISHGVTADEPTSRSGHGADRVTQLLTEQRMIGDEEQYAVTAALMARELGFPARVVLGFVPTGDGATKEITGDQISAWIEVDTVEYGWVTLDPTPAVREIPEEQPEDPSQVARPQSPVQPPVEEQEIPDEPLPPDSIQDDAPEADPFLAVLAVIGRVAASLLVVAAVVIAPFLVIIGIKVRRRRRRRTQGTTLQQISGGWVEFEDAVLDHGYDLPASATRSELAVTVSDARSLLLARSTDRAVFAPERPAVRDVDEVWNDVGELRASLDHGLTRSQRWRARVSLRSLRRDSLKRGTSGSGDRA